jgi:hypothetical protein
MAVLIGFLGAVFGTALGAMVTYMTTRSNMRLALEHTYDQTLQAKRLECYQALFHVSECLPRYWPPMDEAPSRKDLQHYIEDFHDWYFSKDAGGMFLTAPARDLYMRLLDLLAEVAFAAGSKPDGTNDHPLSPEESEELRRLAGELRRQLAEDVGAANSPRLRWARPAPQEPPPGIAT